MDLINQFVVAGAAVLLLTILATRLPYRIGLPLLPAFLAEDWLGGSVVASTAAAAVFTLLHAKESP